MKNRNIPLVVGFCALVIVMSVSFFALPKKDFSENEKRVLQSAPKFSWSRLADGRFFSSLDNYISDHFAGRDFWVGLNAYYRQAIGLNAAGEIYRGKNGWLMERPIDFDTNQKTLQNNAQTIAEFSYYRQAIGLNAAGEIYRGKNGWLMERPIDFDTNQKTLQNNAQTIAEFSQSTDIPVSLLCVPTTGYIMDSQLPAFHDVYSDSEMMQRIQTICGEQVEWIDVQDAVRDTARGDTFYRTDHHWTSRGAYQAYQTLSCAWDIMDSQLPAFHDVYSDSEMMQRIQTICGEKVEWIDVQDALRDTARGDTFYRTDHHWTSRGAYQAYQTLSCAWGLIPAKEAEYEIASIPGFYGTTYSKSGLWATTADQIEIWNDRSVQSQVSIYDENKPFPLEHESMFFETHLDAADKYPVFLDGNHGLVKITSNASSGRLLVVRDSFAHCFAPFLARHFREIDLIDLRYFKEQTVSEYVKEQKYDRILFLYGLSSLAEDRSLQWLA